MHLSTKKPQSQRKALKAKLKYSARLKAKKAREKAHRIAEKVKVLKAAEDIVPKGDIPKERLAFKPLATVAQLEQDPKAVEALPLGSGASDTPIDLSLHEYYFFVANMARVC